VGEVAGLRNTLWADWRDEVNGMGEGPFQPRVLFAVGVVSASSSSQRAYISPSTVSMVLCTILRAVLWPTHRSFEFNSTLCFFASPTVYAPSRVPQPSPNVIAFIFIEGIHPIREILQ